VQQSGVPVQDTGLQQHLEAWEQGLQQEERVAEKKMFWPQQHLELNRSAGQYFIARR